MSNSFVHLQCHSEYSIVDGVVKIKPMMEAVRKAGMAAVALTDQGNFFAAVKFYKAAVASGIKPIFGADLWVGDADQPPFRVTVLCQNNKGYHHLTLLISKSYFEGQQQGLPVVQRAWLAEFNEGLIVLSGGREGDLGQAILHNHEQACEEALNFWQTHFKDRYYISLQRTERTQENDYARGAIALAIEKELPLVVTNEVRFLSQDDFDAHEARVCIHDGYLLSDPKRPRRYSDQQYLKSPEAMAALFKDVPEALQNTVEIAKRCNVTLHLGDSYLPDFPVPDGMTIADFLAAQSKLGLEKRFDLLSIDANGDAAKPYYDRLALELDVINRMGYPGYFLIVADFIDWAKNNDVPVGPGRGSGAGSLVAYALGITDLDPLAYDLLFERFLNPERVSMPDFDVDFCMEGRDRVIEYVAQKYGRQSVSQIITFGTMAARAVVRDVGRVLGFSYGHIDAIAKLIPFEIGMTLEKALDIEENLRERYNTEDDTRQLIDLAKKLEGVARNAGKHAGGVVISPGKLTDFTAIYCEEGSQQIVSQFDKDDVEAVGLVKFDFLGLRNLTIIKNALEIINQQRAQKSEAAIAIETIPLDDPKTFELLKQCQTHAVFQLESRGMRDLIKRLVPDCFEEIIALVALFRPGPLQSGMVDDFINRKHGRAKVAYDHPELKPILEPTYGVILYQEQVMQIAQVLANYTLGSADLLRRAMGKKKPEEMAKQREIFLKGSGERGIDAKLANAIFDLMEKFAGYGFNKSHSAAYALVAYQTAWLKAHFPAEFMAAVLSSDMDNTEKVVSMLTECRELDIKVHLPNVNESDYTFTVNDAHEIVYGLGAIKGVGEAAVLAIVEERVAAGPFTSLFDFCKRLDMQKINKRVLEALVKGGAVDVFDVHRASLLLSVPKGLQFAEQTKRNRATKQVDLFGTFEAKDDPSIAYEVAPEWQSQERLLAEKEVLGWYASGHPITLYRKELQFIATDTIENLKPTEDQAVVVAGFISAMRVMNTKRGDRMAFITLEDDTGRIELAVFSDAFAANRDLLVKDQMVIVEGEVSVDEYSGGYRMSARKLLNMNQARELYARAIALNVHADQTSEDFITRLKAVLEVYRGGTCPVMLNYENQSSKTKVRMGNEWRVNPQDDLLIELRALLGEEEVLVGY